MSKLACYSVSFKYTIKLCTVLHCDQLANSCVLPHRSSKKSQIKNVQHTGGESCRMTAHSEVRGNKTLAQDCSRLAWALDLWVLMNLYFSESSCNSVFPWCFSWRVSSPDTFVQWASINVLISSASGGGVSVWRASVFIDVWFSRLNELSTCAQCSPWCRAGTHIIKSAWSGTTLMWMLWYFSKDSGRSVVSRALKVFPL